SCQPYAECARADKSKRRQLADHGVNGVVDYRYPREPANKASDKRCLVVMGVNQLNLMFAHHLKKLRRQQEIKDQPPVTRPNTDAAIPAYVANTINRDPPYWNAVMKRVGNDANRMSTAGERLRHFPDRCRRAMICRKRAGGNHRD